MSFRRIKILHIITHLELGGAQRTTLALIQGINRKNFEIHFITSPYGYLVKELKKISGIKVKLIPHLRREINLVDDLIAFLRLFNYIRKNHFDIVHTHSPKAGFLGRWSAKLAGVPFIVHTVHGFPFYEKENFFLKRLYILAERFTAEITDRLIVVCESDREKGISAGIGYYEKYVLIREGIEVDRGGIFSSDILYNRLREVSPIMGMVACLKKQKAPFDFVKMASLVKKRFPEAKFVLVGGGPLYKKVERLIRRLGLENNFFLLGWREDVLKIISFLDIVVLTSLWEGLPLVILEAMALKKPIVATRVDGIKELIRDGENGFLVEPGDYCGLAQRVIFLLENKKLQISFVERNQEILSKYNLSSMIKLTEELYYKLMGVSYVH
ncbi:MAG: glycosyltransferase family 4 protein [Candidatus Omnitrophica bacterium]|nr:glycosyltransferase family 4 protein [Candidatus Omnitrophota bacterium]